MVRKKLTFCKGWSKDINRSRIHIMNKNRLAITMDNIIPQILVAIDKKQPGYLIIPTRYPMKQWGYHINNKRNKGWDLGNINIEPQASLAHSVPDGKVIKVKVSPNLWFIPVKWIIPKISRWINKVCPSMTQLRKQFVV